MKTVCAFLFFIILIACNSDPNAHIKSGHITENLYQNDQFGWKFEIPEGWRIMINLEQDYWKNKGNKVADNAFGDKSIDTWINFFSIEKGVSLNQLSANSTKYDPNIHGNSYENSRKTRFYGMKELLERKPNVQVDSKEEKYVIDGLIFDSYFMKLYKNDELKGYQLILEKKFQNNDILMIGLSATDEITLNELKGGLNRSKFTRKN